MQLTAVVSRREHSGTTLAGWLLLLFCLLWTSLVWAFPPTSLELDLLSVTKKPFGNLPDGKAVDLYTLTNAHGIKIQVMTYGGVIVSLNITYRHGESGDIVLGYDHLQGYLAKSPYFGAIVGRFGNRIKDARFVLDGREYHLGKNNPPNTLHGGFKGFDKVLWQARPFQTKDEVGLTLRYTSPDGEEGYPGKLYAKVIYTLNEKNEFSIHYEATTNKTTPITLASHSAFNLAGEGNGDILDHVVMLNADQYTPFDSSLIPNGEILSVKGTPLDFTTPTAVGLRINEKYDQLAYGHGYDSNFVINREGPGLVLAARIYEPTTGRVMEIDTTEPGEQFYTGNNLDGSIIGKHGHVYKKHSGFCLLTQHYPDSPNRPEFPSCILRPGQTYESTTVYKFSTR
jgi:aldose 1-epimerase